MGWERGIPPPGGFLPVPEVADEIRVQHPKFPHLQVLPEEFLGAVGRCGQLLGAVGRRDVLVSPPHTTTYRTPSSRPLSTRCWLRAARSSR